MVNNPRIVSPDLNQYISNRKADVKAEINCIGVGTVIAFDSLEQSVTVQINYLRTIFGAVPVDSPATDQSSNKTVSYPQLVRCPLITLMGGGASITMPVSKGDQCVIFFNDRDIDTWCITGSPNSVPNSFRVHDLNDALIFVGVRSFNNALQYIFGRINLDCWLTQTTGNFEAGNGADGMFTTADGQTITVVKGIIIGIQ